MAAWLAPSSTFLQILLGAPLYKLNERQTQKYLKKSWRLAIVHLIFNLSSNIFESIAYLLNDTPEHKKWREADDNFSPGTERVIRPTNCIYLALIAAPITLNYKIKWY